MVVWREKWRKCKEEKAEKYQNEGVHQNMLHAVLRQVGRTKAPGNKYLLKSLIIL